MAMHPIPEERLAGFLAGRLDREVSEHLKACPACAVLAGNWAAWQDAFACAAAPEAPTEEIRPAWRRWAVAAAVLIVASGFALRERSGSPAPAAKAPESPPSPVAVARSQILLASGSRLSRQGDLAELTQGSCWILADGEEVRLKAGNAMVRLVSGEIILRTRGAATAWWFREALAGTPPVEIAVLAGSAELIAGNKTVRLEAGEAWDGELRRMTSEEPARLREALLAAMGGAPAEPHMLGNVTREGEGWKLEGGDRPSACLASPPAGSYHAAFRLRAREAPSMLGLCFTVDGRSTLWVPEGALPADGAWHSVRILVSPGWVSVLVDGALCRRLRREAFKPNPVEGLDGVGAAVWGGKAEVSGFTMEVLE